MILRLGRAPDRSFVFHEPLREAPMTCACWPEKNLTFEGPKCRIPSKSERRKRHQPSTSDCQIALSRTLARWRAHEPSASGAASPSIACSCSHMARMPASVMSSTAEGKGTLVGSCGSRSSLSLAIFFGLGSGGGACETQQQHTHTHIRVLTYVKRHMPRGDRLMARALCSHASK